MDISAKVSVILPIYKVEKYLRQCIDSVLNQTYQNLEIILVDDGSPDNCGAICDEYKKRDNRIKVIHKENQGLGFARNSGLDIATGEYVLFVDSDDWIQFDMIERLIVPVFANSADLGVCGFHRFYSNERIVDSVPCENEEIINRSEIIDRVIAPIFSDNRLGKTREPCVWTNLYKMKIIKEHNLRFLSERVYLSEDIPFNLDYFSWVERAVFVPYALYYYRKNNESLSFAYREDRYASSTKLYDRLINQIKFHGLYQRFNKSVALLFISKTRRNILLLIHSDLNTKEKKRILNDILKEEHLIKAVNTCSINDFNKIHKISYFFFKHRMNKMIYLFFSIQCKINKV